MNRRWKVKMTVDVLMTAALLFLMSFELVGDAAHEWIGMGMFLLFLLHHFLNRKWTGNLRKGKYTPFRSIQTVLAALLSNVGAEEDIVCRFGGDEYLVFMKSPADTETITTRFRRFKELLQFKALEMNQNVHCSVGICRMNGAGCEYEQCLKIADDALYEVKRNGKNNCVLFEAGRENTKERGKKIIDPTAALRMQEKFYRKIMNMFIAVVYYDAKDGTCEVLKECKPLHDKLPEGNRYSGNVTVFVRLCADAGDQEAVCVFLAEQRIRNQTEPVVSMEYKNAAGGRALVHTFVNTETKEAGGKNDMIAFQDIYTVSV